MNYDVPIAELLAIMLGACRTGAWMAICPPFNSRLIPGTVKALLSVGLTLPLAPHLRGTLPSLATADLIASAALQVFVGAGLGFLTALLFAAIAAAGSLVDLFGGFSVAFAFDPFTMSGTSVFGRFYNILATALLFATDGYALILRGFTTSYRVLPLSGTFSVETLSKLLTDGIGQMFLAAVQIAGPLVAVLFCADVALGLLTRVAPGLNVFSLAFPLKIMLTIGVAGTAIVLLPQAFSGLMDRAVRAMLTLIGG
jgi:flagellar biosynthetic protein FliR